ncbi:MAG: NUDIX hydrolase [Syntrophaceae bacterium]|nr:NUDIX hydrolase [Syntrophaceae bacterium]
MKVRASAVFEQDGKILCLKYIYGGKEVFSIPGGGVDDDISLPEVVVKEWKEEMGIKVKVGDIILVGEAPAGKRYPRTLHIIFEANEIDGNPRVQSAHTTSLDVIWLPIENLSCVSLYPDVGKQLKAYFKKNPRRTITFVGNCMQRGYS